ncbi:hypothetical protein [Bordetella sp. 2513F-2]
MQQFLRALAEAELSLFGVAAGPAFVPVQAVAGDAPRFTQTDYRSAAG